MKPVTTILLLALSALPAAAQPRIVLPEQTHEFGPVRQNTTIRHRFEIQNTGNQPLQIGRIRACCGATARISAMEIAPGTNAYVDVTLSLSGRQGKQTKNIFIASTDPTTPYARFQLTGSVLTTLSIAPRWINFSQAGGSTAQEETITIAGPPDRPFSVTGISIDAPGFAYTHQQTAETTHKITVRTTPPLQPGTTRAILRIETDAPDFALSTIPLSATVASAISVVPAEILLDQHDDGVSRLLAIRCRENQPFNILEAQTMDGSVTIKTAPLANGYRLDISNLIAYPGGDPQEIFITTDREDARLLTVPIRVIPAPATRK
jgi:hypothetical protein